MSGTITSSDDGTNVPADAGVAPGGRFNLIVLNGTTIDADLQVKTSQGNWVKVPSDEGYADITANYMRTIDASPGEFYRLAVTTATGTWDWNITVKKEF